MKYSPIKVSAAAFSTLGLVGLLANNRHQDDARKTKDAAFVMNFASAMQKELKKLPSKPALYVYVQLPLGDDPSIFPNSAIRYAFGDRGILSDQPGNTGPHELILTRREGYVYSPKGGGRPMFGGTGEEILRNQYVFDSKFSATHFDSESVAKFIPDTVQTDVRFRGDVSESAARIAGDAKDFQGFVRGKNKKRKLLEVLICPSP